MILLLYVPQLEDLQRRHCLLDRALADQPFQPSFFRQPQFVEFVLGVEDLENQNPSLIVVLVKRIFHQEISLYGFELYIRNNGPFHSFEKIVRCMFFESLQGRLTTDNAKLTLSEQRPYLLEVHVRMHSRWELKENVTSLAVEYVLINARSYMLARELGCCPMSSDLPVFFLIKNINDY